MILAILMMAAFVIFANPKLFFGSAILWIVTHDILEFGTEVRMQRVRSWVPGHGRRPRGWKTLDEWHT